MTTTALTLAVLAVAPLSANAAESTPGAARESTSAAANKQAANKGRTTRVRTEAQLRNAVKAANKRNGKDRIRLDKSIKFSKSGSAQGGVKRGDLDISDDLVIIGGNNNINANNIDRIFDVRSDVRLVLNRVRMRNGSPASGENGGAIRSTGGKVVLQRSIIENSSASGDLASGGAISNEGGSLRLVNSRLSGNDAERAGGAIESVGGTTTVRRSKLNDNSTGAGPGNGGAIHLTGAGAVSLRDTRVIKNVASAEGGGLWNSSGGTFEVTSSTIEGNVAAGVEADQGGGGLYNDGGSLRLTRTVVRDNQATGLAGSGGGVLNNAGNLAVEGSTVTGNSAQRAGGGIESVAGNTVVRATTLSGNATGAAPGNGGALHLTGAGIVSVGTSDVIGNTASAEGGGLWNSASGVFTVENTVLRGNSAGGAAADQGGGALYNDGGQLSVVGSRIEQNKATGAAGSGGGIFNNGGRLDVDTTMLWANTAPRAGGGIEALIGTTVVSRSTFAENATGPAPGNGGGLHLTGAGTVEVNASEVRGNTAVEGGGFWNSATGTFAVSDTVFRANVATGAEADQGGGALYNDGGSLTVKSATLDANTATGASGSGGGILSKGALAVSGSTFTANTAKRAGGAIETNVGTVDLRNVDASGNSTGAMPGNGGALHVTGAAVVTWDGGKVTGNSASNEGGGLWNSSTGSITATNLTVAGNTSPNGPEVYNDPPGGTFTLNGEDVPVGP